MSLSTGAPAPARPTQFPKEKFMLEIVSVALAKLAALGVAAKTTAGLTAAAAAVAAAGATGVLPALPEQADRDSVQQAVVPEIEDVPDVKDLPEIEDVPDVKDLPEIEDVPDVKDLPEAEDVPEAKEPEDDAAKGEPAPQASFGQSVAEDAREGGVVGKDIAEQARQQSTDRRGEAGRPAELPEQASTGLERAAAGADNSEAGRGTADNAPVEDAPAGTPGADRIPARR